MKHYTYPSILLATLALAACGGGSGGTGTTGAASAGASQTSSATTASGTGSGTSDTSTPPSSGSTSSSTNANPSTSGATGSAPTGSNTSGNTTGGTGTTTSTGGTTAPAGGSTGTSGGGAAASGSPVIVEYYGDSTIWGYNSSAGGQVQTPAPLAFAQALPNPSHYDVRNEGVSGTTACDLVNGTDGKHPAWTTQMANSKATYVLANFAINDEWKYDLPTYKSCMHTLDQVAKQYGKQMIFETPNPTRDSGPGGLDTMVAAMKEVAAQDGVKVIDQYQYLTSYLNGASPYTICPDGLHPTQDVYILKGQYAAKIFPTLIQ